MNLEMLKKALQPLEDFGKDEINFEVSGIKVYLKPLLPKEEISCQKYATGLLESIREEVDVENDAMSRHAALDYFDKFRIEVISYAIVQVGDTDFRNLQYIDTGEVLENGAPKKITKQLAMRELIVSSWSRAMITICFSKYGDLVVKLSEDAEKITEKTVLDIESEISRLKQKLNRLEQEKEKRAGGDPSITMAQISNLVEVGKTMEKEIEQMNKAQEEFIERQNAESFADYVEEKEKEEGKTTQPEPPQPKKPERKQVIPEEVPPPTAQPTQENLTNAQKEARQYSDALSDAKPAGKVGEVDAYRLPAQTLSNRGKTPEKQQQNKVDPSLNPNFRRR